MSQAEASVEMAAELPALVGHQKRSGDSLGIVVASYDEAATTEERFLAIIALQTGPGGSRHKQFIVLHMLAKVERDTTKMLARVQRLRLPQDRPCPAEHTTEPKTGACDAGNVGVLII